MEQVEAGLESDRRRKEAEGRELVEGEEEEEEERISQGRKEVL